MVPYLFFHQLRAAAHRLFTWHGDRNQLSLGKGSAGFTLIELIVAVALFSIVMVICVGALLSLTTANRKAQALQSVMNNLNVAVDSMVRAIRQGDVYHCGAFPYENPADCLSGGDTFAFRPYCPNNCDSNRWRYELVNGAIKKYTSVDGVSWISQDLTAPEVTINDLKFYVVGSSAGRVSGGLDTTQPKVVIVIKGSVGTQDGGVMPYTSFHIQATAVQRSLDI